MREYRRMEVDDTTTSGDTSESEGPEGGSEKGVAKELSFDTFSLDDNEIRSDLLSLRQAAKGDAWDLLQASQTRHAQPAPASGVARSLAVWVVGGGNRNDAKKNLSVNARRSDTGHSLLDMAAAQGHLEGLEAIIARGADVNAANAVGRTALHVASYWDQAGAVDILCASGAGVNDTDDEGCTPLHVAAANGSSEAIIALVHHGASHSKANNGGRGHPAFLVAVESGHLAAATILLHAAEENDEAFVDRRWGEDEYTALDLASRGGHCEILRMIIRHGADINAADSAGVTALYLAALNDQACAVRMLATARAALGAHANGRDGMTALHVACAEGSTEAVHALLSHGAPQHVSDSCHRIPLHLAAARGQGVAVQMLLTFGSDPTFCPSGHSGETLSPLNTAASVGDVRALRAMCNSMLRRAKRDAHGMTAFRHAVVKSIFSVALGIAAKRNNVSCVDALIEAGAEVEAKGGSDRAPPPAIHLAAGAGASDAIAALVRHGADVDSIGEKGRTALQTAIFHGSKRAAEALLKAGADVAKRCPALERQCSALDIAAARGELCIVDALIRHRVDVKAADPDKGITALHIAARCGQAAAVNMLVDAGASVSAPDSDGYTPLHVATTANSRCAMMALAKRGADINKKNNEGKAPIHVAAADPDPSAVDVLVGAGAGINLRVGDNPGGAGEEKPTALDIAAKKGHGRVIVALVAAGAEVEARDRDGRTALIHAVKANQPGAVYLLAAAGANVEAHLEGQRWTSLHSACEDTHLDVVRALLESGASVRAKDADNDNDTPLHVAVRQAGVEGVYEIVETLLRYDADEEALNDHGLSPVSVVGDIVGVDAALPVMELLARAPGNRTWRRRGLLVLCCARAKRGKEGGFKEQGTCEAGKWEWGGGGGSDFEGVAAWLLGLQEEGLFRMIVGFL